ncbi:hypothetical protein E4U59_007625 [Claviceps monticola]|nr:hypothetical protein E4U59_007625 [Claviceps monticola]
MAMQQSFSSYLRPTTGALKKLIWNDLVRVGFGQEKEEANNAGFVGTWHMAHDPIALNQIVWSANAEKNLATFSHDYVGQDDMEDDAMKAKRSRHADHVSSATPSTTWSRYDDETPEENRQGSALGGSALEGGYRYRHMQVSGGQLSSNRFQCPLSHRSKLASVLGHDLEEREN